MNFDRLQTFRLVVQLGSFSRAAEELFLSQPAVSLQIRHLEKELGVVLLERGVNRAKPTGAGEAVLRFSEHVLESRSDLLRELASLQSGSSLVTIGCSPSSARQVIPHLMGELQRIAPHIQLRVTTLPPDEASARLLKGEFDFTLTTDAFISDRLAAEPFSVARLYVVAAPSHPLARKGRATPEELAAYPFALLPSPWTAQRRFREWAANQGVEINVMMELSTYDGLKESARKGLALALIAESNIMREVERGDLVIVNTVGLPLEYTIYLAHRTGKLSPALSIVKTAALNSRLNRAISRRATHADVVREPSLTLS
ncbi:MAG: LysR family transcriptional regulator [Dehalococcoidia bacterium]|jgi:DNA-binding transcriptional LysR family regulator|uniref:LysR family transcriptional regulator n=1 Tax=Candidatus Amarobacter glycogenicus TaxID=3140699 RepID=UPI0031372A60|nr:LysR family transcriptional regulator [Dehalococcoidia bacterium]MBK7126933.1 LysR family transcriptional regulator [Dehalococcoidia bacterium]MBK8558659.1 LysR family transcriptional regulator [Dehalococcoidia bacterium]MBK9344337.1 LysR family transcriptional regulator [Dehalococcoidia bacterium]